MEKKYVRLAIDKIQMDSIVDGEGIRSIIWFQGCTHKCKGCHNPETHDLNAGSLVSIESMKNQIKELEFQQGVTFSGGDPMLQPEALYELAKCVHDNKMDVWCYTGYTFEELIKLSQKNEYIKKVLEEIDVLVDGRFVLPLKSFDAVFRGSTNQRIIDVKSSLEKGEVVLVKKYI